MANLRSGVVVFDSVATTDGGVSSDAANPGQATNVAVMLRNEGATNSATVKIQCAGGPPAAGRNNIPSDDADWYDYQKADGSGEISMVVAPQDSICIDLSPFAPAYIRLNAKSTAAGNSTTVSANIVANG